MSAWRRRAIECLPELREEMEDPGTTIYQVFFELLPATVEAHQKRDVHRLRLYYGFAEWCFRQANGDLQNAAAVAFYEHLADEEITRNALPAWVKKEIYEEIRPLLHVRLPKEERKKVDEAFRGRGKIR